MARVCQRCSHHNEDHAKFCLSCGAMLEVDASADEGDPLIGKVLLGRYRPISVLGEGGMGKVYLSEQKMGTATRKVAIKTLHPELGNDPQLVARFHRESETVIELRHPNTIQFYDFGELEDGTLLTSLYGWFDGDQVREENPLFPIADEAYKTRVIAIRSTDRGLSWEYLSTICYHPEKGREGANEATMVQLPSGDLFVAMRTGLHGYRDKLGRERLDEPLLVTWSRCNGRKWAEPARIHIDNKVVTGIWPTAVVTEGGVLAVIRGRPYGSVIFNPDGTGTIWTNEVRCEATGNASGMDSLALIGPNTVLATYIDHYDWQGDGQSHVIGLPITITKQPIDQRP